MNRDIMEALGFGEEMKRIENRQCPICGKRINIDYHKFNFMQKYSQYTWNTRFFNKHWKVSGQQLFINFIYEGNIWGWDQGMSGQNLSPLTFNS